MPASSWRIQVIPTFNFCDYLLAGRQAGCLSAAQQSMAISSLGFSRLGSTRYVISPLSCVVQRCHAQLVNSNLVMCRVIYLGIVSRLTSRAVHRTVLPCFWQMNSVAYTELSILRDFSLNKNKKVKHWRICYRHVWFRVSFDTIISACGRAPTTERCTPSLPQKRPSYLVNFRWHKLSICLTGNDLALQNVFYALTTSTRKKNVFHFHYINQTLTAHLLVSKIEDSPWLYLYQIRVWRQFSQISGYKRVKPWDLTRGDEAWRAVEALSYMLIG